MEKAHIGDFLPVAVMRNDGNSNSRAEDEGPRSCTKYLGLRYVLPSLKCFSEKGQSDHSGSPVHVEHLCIRIYHGNEKQVLESMILMEFLEFRQYIIPTSIFQSFQFRITEMKLDLAGKSQSAYQILSSSMDINNLITNWRLLDTQKIFTEVDRNLAPMALQAPREIPAIIRQQPYASTPQSVQNPIDYCQASFFLLLFVSGCLFALLIGKFL
ncbi:hypothetical protein I4U23_026324 [Adineta vaga]|nr:hypothetical protein I4U23_026324 [Adineta vaga]